MHLQHLQELRVGGTEGRVNGVFPGWGQQDGGDLALLSADKYGVLGGAGARGAVQRWAAGRRQQGEQVLRGGHAAELADTLQQASLSHYLGLLLGCCTFACIWFMVEHPLVFLEGPDTDK